PNVLYNSFNVLEIFNSWRSNLFNVVVLLSRKEYKWLKLKDWGSSCTVLFSSKIDRTIEKLLIFRVIHASAYNLSINAVNCLRFTVYKFTCKVILSKVIPSLVSILGSSTLPKSTVKEDDTCINTSNSSNNNFSVSV